MGITGWEEVEEGSCSWFFANGYEWLMILYEWRGTRFIGECRAFWRDELLHDETSFFAFAWRNLREVILM